MAANGVSDGTLIQILRRHAERQPDRTAFTYLADGEVPSASLTYGELDTRARAVAYSLAERCRPGERVLLVFDSDPSLILGFFGCLYAGLIAVPVPVPRPRRDSGRLGHVAADCGPSVVLTERALVDRVRPGVGDLPVLAMEDATDPAGTTWRLPDVSRDALAFLQYTSGSTAAPRGVRVRHDHLLANQHAIRAKFGHDAETVVVGWLPFHHDMGLIGNVLQTVYLGASAVLMPPAAFVQQPARWLRAISRFGATTAGGPNFAYDLCVQRITPDQRDGLELSRWRVAFNGAEPIRESTLAAFSAAFAGCGFRDTAFYPCYGLAEATLLVTGGRAGWPRSVCHVDRRALETGRVILSPSDDLAAVALVGCGGPADDHVVTVHDPDTSVLCAPGVVGEVWVRGPSVADGYWGRAEETQNTFGPESQTLRTGDLGFFHDGHLYIVGRRKDVIIIRGVNHYPEDIELTVVRCHPALEGFRGVVVRTTEGEECAVVHEVGLRIAVDECLPIATAIRAVVVAAHGVRVSTVALVRAGYLPVATSGKPQRGVTGNMLWQGTLTGMLFLHHG